MDIIEVKKKYRSIRDRAFDSYLDMFLVHTYLEDNNLHRTSIDHFKLFDYNKSIIDKCLPVYQLTSDKDIFGQIRIKDLDDAIDAWHKDNSLKEYKDFFVQKRIIGEADFIEFYTKDEDSQECEYCHTKQKDLDRLIEKQKIRTKRLSTRGRSLEVDQRDPNKGYVKGNLALCCYWCNNAKTDEFTEKEFIPIGQVIGKKLRTRLKK